MAKEFARTFYLSYAWEKCRKAYARSVGGLCEDCLEHGLYTPGKVVHHRKPITRENICDTNVTLAWDNLRFLCQDCHAKAHADMVKYKREKRYLVGDDGDVCPPYD